MAKQTFKQFLIENDAYNNFVQNYKEQQKKFQSHMLLCDLMKNTEYSFIMHQKLENTFCWESTPEGHAYWKTLILKWLFKKLYNDTKLTTSKNTKKTTKSLQFLT